jgi:hypothetical protein
MLTSRIHSVDCTEEQWSAKQLLVAHWMMLELRANTREQQCGGNAKLSLVLAMPLRTLIGASAN